MMKFFGTQHSDLKKMIKRYEKRYKDLFKVEKLKNEVVDDLRDVTNNQLQIIIQDLKMLSIAIDRLISEKMENDPNVIKDFFEKIPKFSNIDNKHKVSVWSYKVTVLPENYFDKNVLKDMVEQKNKMKEFKTALCKKERYGNFVCEKMQNKSFFSENDDFDYYAALDFTKKQNFPDKLKKLMIRDIENIKEIQHFYFDSFFDNIEKNLNERFIFMDLNRDLDANNLAFYLQLKALMDENIIDKKSPFKKPIFTNKKELLPYSHELGILNVIPSSQEA